MKTKNNNFAYDLEVGQNGENIFADLLTEKKLKLKPTFRRPEPGTFILNLNVGENEVDLQQPKQILGFPNYETRDKQKFIWT